MSTRSTRYERGLCSGKRRRISAAGLASASEISATARRTGERPIPCHAGQDKDSERGGGKADSERGRTGQSIRDEARIWADGALSTSRSCLAVGGLGQVPASSRHTSGVHVGIARWTTQSPLPGPRQEPFLISTRSSDEDDASRGNKLNRVVRPMRAPPARRRLWWRRNSGAWD